MRFGICAAPNDLEAATQAGYDYLEPAVTGMLQPERPEAEVLPPLTALFAASRLNPESYNVLLPGDLKVVGPELDVPRQDRYLDTAFRRAKRLGGEIVVFGSGGARRIPEGWPPAEARVQMVEFLSRCGEAAQRHGIVVAIEPLNVTECNFINSVAEAVALAEEAARPAIRVLSDLYHVAHDEQSYEETRAAAPWLSHVHVAGQGRRAPIAADHDFLRGYFAVLKDARYTDRISVEANWDNLAGQAADARQALQRAWNAA